MRKTKVLLILSIIFLSFSLKAAVPTWSVDPNLYSYNMTITGAINTNYIESTDPNDIIAAFVGGECRGLVHPVYKSEINRYICYLMVYSNVSTQALTFKIYDASADQVYDVSKTITFAVNGIIGSMSAPYIWSSPTLSSESFMLTYSLPNQTKPTVFNGFNISVEVPFGTDLTNLVATYTTSPLALVKVNNFVQTSATSSNDFTNTISYWLRSADETTTNTYNVTVSIANAAPTDITLSKAIINETSQIGAVVGDLTSADLNTSDTHTYTLVAGTGSTDNASFSILQNQLILNTVLDYETKTSYNVRLKTDDGKGGTFEKQFVISVIDENDEAPQFSAAQITIPENNALAAVYTVVATDADDNVAFRQLNYSITAGNSQAKFSIVPATGVISLISALNYETTTNYQLEVSVSDGVNTTKRIITINISDINDETPVVTNAQQQILETKLVGEQVQQVAASDADANSNLTYTITNGNTGSAFAINATTGIITVSSPLNFEVTTTYTLEISVFDGINTGKGTMFFNIVDVNDESPVVQAAFANVDETTIVSTPIHTIIANDADANTTLTYSIVSGNTDNEFGVNANTGVIRVLKSLNYELTTTYYLSVAAFDGIHTTTGIITINVIDQNDEIPVVQSATVAIPESQNIGTNVCFVQATDADANSIFTYSITGGNSENKFQINANTGEITLAAMLQYETTSQYVLTIKVNDGVNNAYGTITINVQDLNDEFPVVTSDATTLHEDAVNGQIVFNVLATDPDGGSVLTYSITAGNINSTFKIDPAFGIITLLGLIDYETLNTYTLTVEVNDGLHQSTGDITINILNTNDETPIFTNDTKSISESLAIGADVIQTTANDPDGATQFQYSISSGNSNLAFNINSNTGLITVAKQLDFETISSFNLTIAVFDGIYTGSGQIVINILDENDETPVVQNATVSVPETENIGTIIKTVQVTDADANSVFNYSITGGNSENKFQIDANTGEISIAAVLQYEITNQYILDIKVNDGVNDAYGTITVNVQDTNDEFPVVTSDLATLSEDAINGQIVYNVLATDPDGGTVLTYTITAGNTNSTFRIDPTYGIITLLGSIDYETLNTYSLTVEVNDGLHQSTGIITINLLNINDETPIFTNATTSISESLATGMQVIQTIANDPDGATLFEYSILSGNSNLAFNIDPNTGLITVAKSLDFETLNNYKLTIAVFDEIYTGSGEITINILDENDEIPVVQDATEAVSETKVIGTIINTVKATDADANSVFTYSITNGNDEAKFDINQNTGEISILDSLDYETTTSYVLTVEVNDAVNQKTGTVNINVLDENDETPSVQNATEYVPENSALGYIVHSVIATDADANSVFTYQFTPGNADTIFAIDQYSGVITLINNLDFELNPKYILEVEVSDGIHIKNGTYTINIINKDDNAPVVQNATVTVSENVADGTVIQNIVATDQDVTSVLKYTITSGNNQNKFLVNSSTGAVSVVGDIDFETVKIYSLQIDVSDGTNTSIGLLTINISDENDETPVLKDTTLSIQDNTILYSQLVTFVATDKDANSTLTYTLSNDFDGTFELTTKGALLLKKYLNYAEKTSYEFEIEVSDGLNKSKNKVTINVLSYDKANFKAYKIISPNGDNYLDTWQIQNAQIYRDCYFQIFNTAGEIILKQTGYEIPWDGTYNGKELPIGAYYYIITIPGGDYIKGVITLIK